MPREPCHDFDSFYKEYPKKQARAVANVSWNKLNPDRDLVGLIISAIAANRKTAQWQKDNGQFIPMPATWLNQRRWEDEIEVKPVNKQDAFFERQKQKLHSEGR